MGDGARDGASSPVAIDMSELRLGTVPMLMDCNFQFLSSLQTRFRDMAI